MDPECLNVLALPDTDPSFFVRILFGSGIGFFHHEANMVRKNLILHFCDIFMYFLSLKNDGNVLHKAITNKHKHNIMVDPQNCCQDT